MRFGFIGSMGTAAQLVRMAQDAEEHGWDGFFTWDGISLGPMDTWDPWVLLGAIAARTERIRLGAMVFALARRRPWKVAREALTLDHLSGGRLVLPVGLGAVDDGGFSRVRGEPLAARDRAARVDEALALLERAWTGERFSWEGTHYGVEDLQVRPRPVQRPRVPVWPVAAWPSERSLARAARWDGAVLQRRGGQEELSPDDVRDAVARLHTLRHGGVVTDRAADERAPAIGDGVPAAEVPAREYDVVVEGVLPRDTGRAAARTAELAAAGATWWVESRWDTDRDSPETLLARIRQGPPR